MCHTGPGRVASVHGIGPAPCRRALLPGVASPEPCTTLYRYKAVETQLRVSPGLAVRLRNPYGARVNIGRSFVQFRVVYASPADRAKVSAVEWALDGVPSAYKRGSGRDAYLFGSFHLTEGLHIVTAKITPAGGGPPAGGEIRFAATRCEPLSFTGVTDNRKAPGTQPREGWATGPKGPAVHITSVQPAHAFRACQKASIS